MASRQEGKISYTIQLIKKVQMIQEKERRDLPSSKMFTYQEKSASSLNYYYKNILINVVHPSNKSDTHLRIIRKPLRSEVPSQLPPQQENPYAIVRKSYSTRRNLPQQCSTRQLLRNAPSKRIKRQNTPIKQTVTNFTYNLSEILHEIKKKKDESFNHQFRPSLNKEKQTFKYSFKQQMSEKMKKENPMLSNEIDIISNSNQKISISIHEGLLKANINHEKLDKDEHFLSKVKNPFDYERKNHYLQSISFIKDYKSGYAPIDMQLKNSDEADETYIGSTKSHFIRKKQSTLSLPRSCGVSYIKESESFQGKPYQPLPPLIFQCSSNCRDTKGKYEQQIKKFIQLTESMWICFIKTEQSHMRDLLLGKKIGEIGWVKGIKNLWPLFAESLFLLLIFGFKNPLSQNQVWNSYGNSLFKIGIVTKKSTSGKKSFFKSIGIEENNTLTLKEKKSSLIEEKETEKMQIKREEEKKQDHQKQSKQLNTPESEQKKQSGLSEDIINELKDCRNVITLSLRMEMYVEENQWKNCTQEQKDLLCTLITGLKENLEKESLQIIKLRLNLAKSNEKQSSLKNLLCSLKKSSEDIQNTDDIKKLVKSRQKFSIQTLKILLQTLNQPCNLQHINNFSFSEVMKINKNQTSWQKTLKMPLYYISTRDSFAFDLIEKVSYFQRNDHQYKKIQYYFQPDNIPSNYNMDYKSRFPQLNVGVTCYHNFFTDDELKYFESKTFETEENAFKNKFLQMTVQPSIIATKIKRTKFFFGYRYMWTRCQLAEPGSHIGAGVRKDVTPPPKWTKKIQNDLVQHQIVEKDFFNSIAINVYHDGKEGLAQHFDDAVRFRQPIYTLRLFSDARLSFGSQFYGFCNGAFIIPLPRGCICVMGENSYAANGVKHCVRPCDMTGKSAAVIMRQMHSQVVNESAKYDELIDFPAWVSSLSEDENSTTFAQQKRRQSEYYLNLPK